jgi:hypothetical protein
MKYLSKNTLEDVSLLNTDLLADGGDQSPPKMPLRKISEMTFSSSL